MKVEMNSCRYSMIQGSKYFQYIYIFVNLFALRYLHFFVFLMYEINVPERLVIKYFYGNKVVGTIRLKYHFAAKTLNKCSLNIINCMAI